MTSRTILAVTLTALLVAPAGGAWAASKPETGGSGTPGMMRGPGPRAGGGSCSEAEGGPHFHFHGHGHGMGPDMMWMMGGVGPLWKLDLTDAQLAKIRPIQQELLTRTMEMHGKVLETKAQLPKLYAATPMDAAAIGKVYGRIFGLYQQMIQQCIEAQNQVVAVLNPDQRQRYERWRSEMMMMGPGMMGGMGMGMGGGMMDR